MAPISPLVAKKPTKTYRLAKFSSIARDIKYINARPAILINQSIKLSILFQEEKIRAIVFVLLVISHDVYNLFREVQLEIILIPKKKKKEEKKQAPVTGDTVMQKVVGSL